MSALSQSGAIHEIEFQATNRIRIYKSILVLITLTGLTFNYSWAQDTNEERIYLRYQGQIEGANEIGNTIDCLFEFTDSDDQSLHRERNPNVLVINNAFTVTLGAGSNPFEPDSFLGPVKLLTQCDLDRDGSYDVVTSEIIGSTPKAAVALSVKGSVDADYIRVNGSEVVSPDGEWLGSVVTDQDLRANTLEVSSANITDQLNSTSAYLQNLSINTLSHRVDSDSEASPLINNSGAWIGEIVLPDQDQDGVLDWIEELLGSDPLDSESKPLDNNQDGIFDLLQGSQQDSNQTTPELELPFDVQSLSNRFTLRQSAEDYFTEQSEGVPWVAASINVEIDAPIENLSIELSTSHPSGVHFISLQLVTPNGQAFTLIEQSLAPQPDQIETQSTYQFSIENVPEGLDWSQITHQGEEARSLQGDWQIVMRNASNDQVSPTLDSFTLIADYTSTQELTLTRDMNLQEIHRVTGLPTPQADSDASTKSYVDQAINQVTETVNTYQQANDPSYPDGMVYRYRTFEVYDVSSMSYLFQNNPEFYAGQGSAFWGSGLVRAAQLEINDLDDFLNQSHKARQNAVVVNQVYTQENEAQGFFTVFHTQVENSTDANITWNLTPHFSCHNLNNGIQQVTSVALNGVENFVSTNLVCTEISNTALVTFDFPPNQVSDIVFVIAASAPNSLGKRRLFFAFGNQELATLPEGLSFRKTW